jgi:hypothetical protein
LPHPGHLVTISPHNLPDNLSSQSLTHEGCPDLWNWTHFFELPKRARKLKNTNPNLKKNNKYKQICYFRLAEKAGALPLQITALDS